MRKAILILILGLLLLIMATLRAADGPYLVCDPVRFVTHYEVTLDGEVETVPAYDLGDGTVMLRFDLSGIEMGSHHVSVSAMNVWGMSGPATLDFTKALPDAAVNVRIED